VVEGWCRRADLNRGPTDYEFRILDFCAICSIPKESENISEINGETKFIVSASPFLYLASMAIPPSICHLESRGNEAWRRLSSQDQSSKTSSFLRRNQSFDTTLKSLGST